MCAVFMGGKGEVLVTLAVALSTAVMVSGGNQNHGDNHGQEGAVVHSLTEQRGRASEELPKIPPADARAADVPSGYRVEVAFASLMYPTSMEFDDRGATLIAEGGYIYGDEIAPARILKVVRDGEMQVVADQLSAPITDLLWHDGRLYISHRGKISVLERDGVRDLVTGLPSLGDHHNNQMAIGPDGKLYFGQGVATNSGVVGLDNYKTGWLAKYPDVYDVPAKDIRVTDQMFETPDPLTLFSEKSSGDNGDGNSDGGHGATTQEDSKSPDAHEDHQQHHHESEPQNNATGEGKGQRGQSSEHNTTKTGHEGHTAKEANRDESEGRQERSAKVKANASSEGHSNEDAHQHHADQTADAEGTNREGHQGSKVQSKKTHHEGTDHKSEHPSKAAKTFGFQPFGKTPPDDGALRGTTKASGTILRMNLDGSDLEVYAWGLRNPFGVAWGTDQELYVSDNGYDERGSRPIAHAPDCLWRIKRGAWYGFPDYAGGIPVTDARFRPEHGPAPKFLMRDHPPVERPILRLRHHVGASKMAFSHSTQFGFKGQLFLALAGDMNPITGIHEERLGFEVVRIDPGSGKAETFFKAKKSELGPKGMEYVATAGPRRLVDVQFSPDGNTLYVVDVGAMAIVSTAAGPVPRPFPGTGVIWRVARSVESPATSESGRKQASPK